MQIQIILYQERERRRTHDVLGICISYNINNARSVLSVTQGTKAREREGTADDIDPPCNCRPEAKFQVAGEVKYFAPNVYLSTDSTNTTDVNDD